MRIKYIIPFPFDDEGIANRAAQIPARGSSRTRSRSC